MKIKIGKIELTDWESNVPINSSKYLYWARYVYYVYFDPNNSDVNTVITIQNTPFILNQCFVNFYPPLAFLHKHFAQDIEGDFELAKKKVDEFLIRISKLKAFI